MKKYDCDICLSAGSVNQWGFCEICGEDFEDAESLVAGGRLKNRDAFNLDAGELFKFMSAAGRDAA